MPLGTVSPTNLITVRLIRKYAEMINGVDLAYCEVGDVLRLPARDAALLLAEGWALPCEPSFEEVGEQQSAAPPPARRQTGRIPPPDVSRRANLVND